MPYGYDLTDKLGYRLMQGRLGIYDKYKAETQIQDPKLIGLDN